MTAHQLNHNLLNQVQDCTNEAAQYDDVHSLLPWPDFGIPILVMVLHDGKK